MDFQYNLRYMCKRLLLSVQNIEHLFHMEMDYMVAPLQSVLEKLENIDIDDID